MSDFYGSAAATGPSTSTADAPDKPIEAYPIDPNPAPFPPVPPPSSDAAPAPAPAATGAPKHVPVVTFADTEANHKTLMLAAPVLVDGVLITEVTVTRPTAALIDRWIAAGGEGTLNSLFERMAGLSEGVLPQLFLDDVLAIQEAGNGFLPRALQRANPSSAT